jgi:hypothetical protein
LAEVFHGGVGVAGLPVSFAKLEVDRGLSFPVAVALCRDEGAVVGLPPHVPVAA